MIAERLRLAVQDACRNPLDGSAVTISVGFATAAAWRDPAIALREADAALYQAKRGGAQPGGRGRRARTRRSVEPERRRPAAFAHAARALRGVTKGWARGSGYSRRAARPARSRARPT